ncbi:MAG TPA: HdeA/HdeB family chaperone [Xanthomonadales bacterium]
MKAKKNVLAVTLALALVPVCATVADETPEAVETGLQVQFNEMTCGEMLRQTGDTREFTMIFMHGVINGLRKDYLFDAVKVSEAIDKIYDMCVADTKANLLEVFEKARS